MTARPAVPVLLVDDNPSKRLALKAILEPLGYSLVEAASGVEALRCVMGHEFAVILMDVVMPDMDGFETAALIRQRRQSQMTPIIFITAHGKDEIAEPDLYAEGAVDFIFAPVPPHELRAKVSVFANLFLRAKELAARAAEVQVSSDQLRLLTDAAPVGIFQTDAQNRYVYTNPRWSEITGIGAEEAKGQAWSTIVAAEQPSGLAPEIRSGDAEQAELSHRFVLESRGSDSRGIVHVTSKAVPDGEGGVEGWVGTLADVTAEAGAELAMEEARDKAHEASQLKSDFLANMSHEIRTPMNGVIGMTDMLLETQLDASQRDYAMTVRNSGEALLAIVGDILDFSKIEAGHLEVEEIEYDMRSTVAGAVDLLAASAQAKGLEVVVAIESAVPTVVTGDPGRVRQVLTNLVANAIKFTDTGEVVVRVAMAEFSGDGAMVRFAVSDTGDGMAPETLDHVFQPFIQADSSTSRKYGGTGLGLTISRQLVELMGGECGVSSELGEGSEFWFTVSVGFDSARAAHPHAHEARLAGMSALVIDDNASQRGVLADYLKGWGMLIEVAGSGPEAVAAMRSAADRRSPIDVVMLDLSMPGSNGLALREEMATDPVLAAPTVLMVDFGEEGRASGPDGCPCVSKPIHPEALRRCLLVALGLDVNEGEADGPALAPSEERADGHLLLVEDNLVNQKVALAMLSGAGYSVDTALNGADAVSAVAERRYDTILMDCQMPVMNGFEATTAIRRYEGEKGRTPIIAMTAGALAEDRERCSKAGMDGYLAKPVRKENLLGLVARHVKTGMETAQGPDDEPEGVQPEILDETVVAELENLDGNVLNGLVPQYFDQSADQILELRGAIDRGETVAVGQLAHKLKGSSGALGVASVSHVASELEVAAGAGDLTAADSLLDRLDTGLDEAKQAFHSRGV